MLITTTLEIPSKQIKDVKGLVQSSNDQYKYVGVATLVLV